jgi:hypothetical protein
VRAVADCSATIRVAPQSGSAPYRQCPRLLLRSIGNRTTAIGAKRSMLLLELEFLQSNVQCQSTSVDHPARDSRPASGWTDRTSVLNHSSIIYGSPQSMAARPHVLELASPRIPITRMIQRRFDLGLSDQTVVAKRARMMVKDSPRNPPAVDRPSL